MQEVTARKRLFNKIEIVVVIAILGVAGSSLGPRLTQAASLGPEHVLADQLQLMRTQILIYRAEHHGMPPGFSNGDINAKPSYEMFVAQMTNYTDVNGHVSTSADPMFRYGSYLHDIPMNPFNESASIQLISDDQPMPRSASGDAAWIYKPGTGALAANVPGRDGNEVLYIDY